MISLIMIQRKTTNQQLVNNKITETIILLLIIMIITQDLQERLARASGRDHEGVLSIAMII